MGTEQLVEFLWRSYAEPKIIVPSGGQVITEYHTESESVSPADTGDVFVTTTFWPLTRLGSSTFGRTL